MSTRRARIKAVASLPVRRKNNTTAPPDKTGHATVLSLQATVETRPEVTESSKEITGSKSPSVKNETKAVHTPQIRRTPLRTPNLIERVPSTPRSVITCALSPRRSSPLVRSSSPSVKWSPAVKQTTSYGLLHKALKDNKSKADTVKQTYQEDYNNPPSIPESETEDTVLDGIIPLSHCNASNPAKVLKNEIISEHAEVLFDPIVPLPSPGKVRPKLRPAPRFPIRRNSIQGSASESEDEKRAQISGATTPAPPRARHESQSSSAQPTAPINRELNRVRNDSLCSSVSQAAPAPPPPASPLREKMFKSRRAEGRARGGGGSGAARRRRPRPDVQRHEMTMYDLIFFNPTTNPIVRDEEDTKVVESEPDKPKEVIEEKVDDPLPPPPPDDAAPAPAPQIKLGPNGEIILDEKSLVIEQTELKRKLSSSIVHESAWASSGRGRYSRARRTADWPPAETVRFYRALAAVGTDFTLMEPLFPGRTRKDLKIKFKKEEKLNSQQVDKALRSQTAWDGLRLEDEFADDRAAAAAAAAAERRALLADQRRERARLRAAKEDGFRTSKAAKALEARQCRSAGGGLTADAFLSRDAERRRTPTPALQPPASPRPPFATLTLLPRPKTPRPHPNTPDDSLAVLTPTSTQLQDINAKNIETGSLVVLTVNDPKNPTKKMLQTYISHGDGKLTPIALPSTLLGSVMGYMKKGTPKSSVSDSSSPQFMSPDSERSQESTRSSVITINPSPSKRSRHNSYNITQL